MAVIGSFGARVAAEAERARVRGEAAAAAQLAAMLEDVKGQAAEACQRAAWQRWGRHYLPSLGRAHQLQQCNNFKDPGVQGYGGDVFREVRDLADAAFMRLPAPKPSCLPAAQQTRAAPVDMRMYYNASGGCIAGGCRAQLFQPTGDLQRLKDDFAQAGLGVDSLPPTEGVAVWKRVDDLRAGDVIDDGAGGPAVVQCVVKTLCEDRSARLVAFDGGLRITAWHPVMAAGVQGRWSFPADLAAHRADGGGVLDRPAGICSGGARLEDAAECAAVYSFVLARPGAHGAGPRPAGMLVNGVACIALAHGIEGDAVASHAFYGTEAVARALARHDPMGWAAGHITLAADAVIRGPPGPGGAGEPGLATTLPAAAPAPQPELKPVMESAEAPDLTAGGGEHLAAQSDRTDRRESRTEVHINQHLGAVPEHATVPGAPEPTTASELLSMISEPPMTSPHIDNVAGPGLSAEEGLGGEYQRINGAQLTAGLNASLQDGAATRGHEASAGMQLGHTPAVAGHIFPLPEHAAVPGAPEPNTPFELLTFSMISESQMRHSPQIVDECDGQAVPPRLMQQLTRQLSAQFPQTRLSVLPEIVTHMYKDLRWVEPEAANWHCSARACQAALGGITGGRPHHCRICGDCFCYRCAPKTSELPAGLAKSRAAAVDAHELPSFVRLLEDPAAAAGTYVGSAVSWAVGGWAGAAVAGCGEYRRCESCTRMLETVCAPENSASIRSLLTAIRKMQHRRLQLKLPHHALTTDEAGYLRQVRGSA
jgi:hypothetical protein